ncbi:MAG: efflux RND transporter periplasmic adaptor subunit [Burkholderiales bacterium]|nr:efflux RND transporter periplasmic adaptor subunit [Burkholderiales bacterium]
MNRPLWNKLGAGLAVAAAAAGAYALLRPAPVPVDAAAATRGPLQVALVEQGETRAHDRYVITAPVAGRVMRIDLHDGDAVAEQQVVARIAAAPLSTRERDEMGARVAAAEALEREATARARHAEDDAVQAARERARVEKLVQEKFLSPQAAERARIAETTSADEAQAARHKARAAAAEVRAARAGLAAQSGALITVRAPAAGRILRIAEASERVVAAGAPLMTIGDLARLEIVVEALSTEAVSVKPGMPVLLERWGGTGTLRARVRTVEPHAFTKVSALGVEEKRTNVIADFIDPPGPLGDGFRVTARIVTWSADGVLKAPAAALFRCADGWCVYAIEDGRARRRPVEVGQRNDLEAEIRGGLAEGVRLVRYPGAGVADGTRVAPR